jgi:hypothetical protein
VSGTGTVTIAWSSESGDHRIIVTQANEVRVETRTCGYDAWFLDETFTLRQVRAVLARGVIEIADQSTTVELGRLRHGDLGGEM